ncbi:hypothetical protein BT96DRAFT_1014163 [Gymnopus androsaceus JB14]|uniref:Uncharacterized protein n=1 Tax=Gymnopus androsaceus JB14 TaxID=1447944 RepID=A0A6A4IBZ7_9AGAR|nr:hypothetical protein BT96DRAFT_1014163 [Gymnopus androsaceus JB14]
MSGAAMCVDLRWFAEMQRRFMGLQMARIAFDEAVAAGKTASLGKEATKDVFPIRREERSDQVYLSANVFSKQPPGWTSSFNRLFLAKSFPVLLHIPYESRRRHTSPASNYGRVRRCSHRLFLSSRLQDQLRRASPISKLRHHNDGAYFFPEIHDTGCFRRYLLIDCSGSMKEATDVLLREPCSTCFLFGTKATKFGENSRHYSQETFDDRLHACDYGGITPIYTTCNFLLTDGAAWDIQSCISSPFWTYADNPPPARAMLSHISEEAPSPMPNGGFNVFGGWVCARLLRAAMTPPVNIELLSTDEDSDFDLNSDTVDDAADAKANEAVNVSPQPLTPISLFEPRLVLITLISLLDRHRDAIPRFRLRLPFNKLPSFFQICSLGRRYHGNPPAPVAMPKSEITLLLFFCQRPRPPPMTRQDRKTAVACIHQPENSTTCTDFTLMTRGERMVLPDGGFAFITQLLSLLAAESDIPLLISIADGDHEDEGLTLDITAGILALVWMERNGGDDTLDILSKAEDWVIAGKIAGAIKHHVLKIVDIYTYCKFST